MIKKILIGLAIIIMLLIAGAAFLFFANNKEQPAGKKGDQAELLAQKLSQAINTAAWDSTHYVQWTFRGEHDYLWNRKDKVVEVKWGENKVLLNIDHQSGHAYASDVEITDTQTKDELLKTAYSYFTNDAFWLNAPSMIYNPDVTREYVPLENGHDGLKITYHSGGVTPGDSYLWKLDKDGLPVSYQMWVSIIPIGGLEFTWEDWTTLSTGAKISQMHKSKMIQIPITNIIDGNHFSHFNRDVDPFAALEINNIEIKKK